MRGHRKLQTLFLLLLDPRGVSTTARKRLAAVAKSIRCPCPLFSDKRMPENATSDSSLLRGAAESLAIIQRDCTEKEGKERPPFFTKTQFAEMAMKELQSLFFTTCSSEGGRRFQGRKRQKRATGVALLRLRNLLNLLPDHLFSKQEEIEKLPSQLLEKRENDSRELCGKCI